MNDVQIRTRREEDDDRISFVIRRAFAGEAEAQLVRDLRAEGAMVCEFVAEREGSGIIGHVAFSRLAMRSTDRAIDGVALAPLAVLPGSQRQGVGIALVEHAHAQLRAAKVEVVVVLGDPGYYGRLGFSSLLARFLRAPYSGDGLQALELVPGALGKRSWDVAYPAAFAKLG
jgi:putative acetyltransferase